MLINTYVNYSTIIETTDTVKHKSDLVQHEMDYAKYFQSRYLASEYGHLFLAHDNNIVFWGEVVIGFKSDQETGEDSAAPLLVSIPQRSKEQEKQKIRLSPMEAWQLFLQEKLSH